MAKLCPFRVWLDTNGNALDGGLIYTYITGTSTPKTTYVDSGGITALPNPVVLDSNGCKTIYLDQDAAYRFIVKTSGGTTLETIDEITPVTAFATISGGSVDVTSPDAITSTGTLLLTPSNGIVKVGQFTLPTSAPTVNQVLTASSASTTVWSNPSGSVVQDTQPQLGGNLDCNGHDIFFDDNTGILDDSLNEQLVFQKTASAVNQFEMTNSATGNAPALAVAGGDTNIGMNISSKGSGVIAVTGAITGNSSLTIGSNLIMTSDQGIASSNGLMLKLHDVASAVNYLQASTAATGNSVDIAAIGTDSNIGVTVTPKGTGSVVLPKTTIGGTAFPSATGTTNQSLVLSAAGTAVWGSASGTNGKTYLGTFTASDDPTLDVTGLTGYSAYEIEFSNLNPATTLQGLRLRCSTNGGSSYDSSDIYGHQQLAATSTTISAENDTITSFLVGGPFLSSTTRVAAGTIKIYPSDGTSYNTLMADTFGWETGAALVRNLYACTYQVATAVNAVQFFMSSGNITTGSFRVYGLY